MDDHTVKVGVDSTGFNDLGNTMDGVRAKAESLDGSIGKLGTSAKNMGGAFGKGADEAKRKLAELLLATEQSLGNLKKTNPEGASFLDSLVKQAAATSGVRNELNLLKASTLGVEDQVANLIAGMAEAAGGMEGFRLTTARARAELIVLIHEMLQGNFRRLGASLLVFAEYTDLGPTIVSRLGAAFGFAAGAAALLTGAFIAGTLETKHFQDALLVTGNAAGATMHRFEEMAEAIHKGDFLPIGEVKEFGDAILKTGRFNPVNFEDATRAAANFGRATGLTAEKIAGQFEKLADSPLKFATELNKSTGFLSASQYELVRAFELSGDTASATGVVLKALGDRFNNTADDTSPLLRRIHELQQDFSNLWNFLKGLGRPETVEDVLHELEKRAAAAAKQIREAQSAIDSLPKTSGGSTQQDGSRTPEQQAEFERARRRAAVDLSFGNANNNTEASSAFQAQQQLAQTNDQLAAARRAVFLNSERATAEAIRTEYKEISAAARAWADEILEAAKNSFTLRRELEQAQSRFLDAKKGDKPITDEEQKVIVDQIFKKHTERNNSEDEVRLRADLKVLQDNLQKERDAVTFQNQFLDAQFKVGALSIADLYKSKVASIQQGVTLEVAELEKEKKRIQESVELALARRDSVGAERDIGLFNQKADQQNRLRIQGSRQIQLEVLKEAEAYRELIKSVSSFDAELARLRGDDALADRIQSAQKIADVNELAKRIKLPTTGDLARFDKNPDLFKLPPPAVQPIDDRVKEFEEQLRVKNQLLVINDRLATSVQTEQIAEQRLAVLQSTNAITETEALNRINELRNDAIPRLEALVEEQERVAATRPTDYKLQVSTLNARLELEKFKATLDPVKRDLDDFFKTTGANFLSDLMSKPKDAFKNLIANLSQGINSRVAAKLSDELFAANGPFSKLGGFVAKNLFGETPAKEIPKTTGDFARLDRANDKEREDKANQFDPVAAQKNATEALNTFITALDKAAIKLDEVFGHFNAVGLSGAQNEADKESIRSLQLQLTRKDLSDGDRATIQREIDRRQSLIDKRGITPTVQSSEGDTGESEDAAALRRARGDVQGVTRELSRPGLNEDQVSILSKELIKAQKQVEVLEAKNKAAESSPPPSEPNIVNLPRSSPPQFAPDRESTFGVTRPAFQPLTTDNVQKSLEESLRNDSTNLFRSDDKRTEATEQSTNAIVKSSRATLDNAQAAGDAALSVLQLAEAGAHGASALSLLPGILQTIAAAFGISGGAGGVIGKVVGAAVGFFSGGVPTADGSGATGDFARFDRTLGKKSGGYVDYLGYMEGGFVVDGEEEAGFDTGGFTGAGPVDKVAGVVHGGEFVFSAPAVRTLGKDTLAQVHEKAKAGVVSPVDRAVLAGVSPRGFQSGGFVDTSSISAGRQSLTTNNNKVDSSLTTGRGGDTVHINVNVTPPPGGSRQTAMQWGAEAGKQLQTAMRRNGK